jgi:homoserine kinase
VRSKLIKGFNEIKKTAIDNGAIGSSISGSGPTIFALCASKEDALNIINKMEETAKHLKLNYNSYVSSINHSGLKIIN